MISEADRCLFNLLVLRKNSCSTVPLKRSTKPLVLGAPTRAVRCLFQRQEELIGSSFGAAEFAAVVGEHGAHRQVELGVARQDLVMHDRDRCLRLLGDVEKAAQSVRYRE